MHELTMACLIGSLLLKVCHFVNLGSVAFLEPHPIDYRVKKCRKYLIALQA